MIIDTEAWITEKQNWNHFHLLSIESSEIAQKSIPGQFIMVRVSSGFSPLLRRPFSIHSKKGNIIEIFFKALGKGTILLSQKNTGETIDILGPLGKGFTLHPDIKGKKAALVGGGRGIAPLYFLAKELKSQNVSLRFFYGGKTSSELPLSGKLTKDHFDTLYATDDGTTGFKGFISDLFKKEIKETIPDYVYACGPELMMKKVYQTAQEYHIPSEFSLESIMGCGIGACWGCVKKILRNQKEEWLKICTEGPVFKGSEIIW